MSSSGYASQTADAARDAVAFVLAVQRGDAEAIAAIFNNADPFDLSHMIARYFLDFIEATAVTGPQVPGFQSRAQAKRWAAQQSREFLESLQRDQQGVTS